MELESKVIVCSIFLDTEAVIKKTENKVKKAKSTKERRYYAQDILLEAGTLLICSNYNAKNPDCVNCRSILHKFIQEYKYLAEEKKRRKSYV